MDAEELEAWKLEVPDYPPDEDYYWSDLENGCE